MSRKDITLNVTSIGEVSPDYRRCLDVELKDVNPDDVVVEFGCESLLESMDLDSVKEWLEDQGYTVTEDE